MKTKETLNTRELALEWWNSITYKNAMLSKYNHHNKDYTTITNSEIEEIWKLEKPNQKQYSQEEVDELLDRQAAESTHQTIKAMKALNQKQFKTFDKSLFKSYINKFSNEDKLNAFKALTNELPNSNFKYYILKWFSI